MMVLGRDAIKCSKVGKINEVMTNIFKEGSSKGVKNLQSRRRIWAKILLGGIHHCPAGNSADYINADQKYMLYYFAKGVKMNLPSILFKYWRERVKEIRNSGSKHRKCIPLGRMILDIHVEIKLVAKLEEMNFRDDLYTEVGKYFNRKNLKNIIMIINIVNQVVLDREHVSTKRVEFDDFPIFTKPTPRCSNGLHKNCLESGIDP